MASMLQLVRYKHTVLVAQRHHTAQHQHAQIYAGSICPPSVVPFDKHSGVDCVLLANMTRLLDAIYTELAQRNRTLKKISRLEVMNQLEGSGRPSDHPIFCALYEELSGKSASTPRF